MMNHVVAVWWGGDRGYIKNNMIVSTLLVSPVKNAEANTPGGYRLGISVSKPFAKGTDKERQLFIPMFSHQGNVAMPSQNPDKGDQVVVSVNNVVMAIYPKRIYSVRPKEYQGNVAYAHDYSNPWGANKSGLLTEALRQKSTALSRQTKVDELQRNLLGIFTKNDR